MDSKQTLALRAALRALTDQRNDINAIEDATHLLAEALKGYNGWPNYETWCVHLWLSNDQGTDKLWRSVALRTAAGSNAQYMARDLTLAALSEVDWHTIADAFLEGIPEYDALDNEHNTCFRSIDQKGGTPCETGEFHTGPIRMVMGHSAASAPRR